MPNVRLGEKMLNDRFFIKPRPLGLIAVGASVRYLVGGEVFVCWPFPEEADYRLYVFYRIKINIIRGGTFQEKNFFY